MVSDVNQTDRWNPSDKEFPGKNVRISLNGPAALSFDELQEMNKAIQEATEALEEKKFIVRFYDGFDNQWMDVSKPLSKEEAEKVWNKETKNGTEKTKFEDIDYYKIFPADTRMIYSDGFGEI